MEALINALTADKLAGDKLKTECETIMNNDAYKEACKAVLNAKTQTLVTYVHIAYNPSDNSNT